MGDLSAEELFYELDMICVEPIFENLVGFCNKKEFPFGESIYFDLKDESVTTNMNLSKKHIEAIYKKINEFGWK